MLKQCIVPLNRSTFQIPTYACEINPAARWLCTSSLQYTHRRTAIRFFLGACTSQYVEWCQKFHPGPRIKIAPSTAGDPKQREYLEQDDQDAMEILEDYFAGVTWTYSTIPFKGIPWSLLKSLRPSLLSHPVTIKSSIYMQYSNCVDQLRQNLQSEQSE